MASNIDQLVGAQIRARRWALGMTQTDLAQAIGVRYQQVQKYETGANQITVSRLVALAQALKTDVNYFLENMHQTD